MSSNNILNTVQGAAFFVDLEKLIEEEIKIADKRALERKIYSTNTAIYIPLYDKMSTTIPNTTTTIPTNLSNTFTKEDFQNLQKNPIESMDICPTVTKPFPVNPQSPTTILRPLRKSLETKIHSPRDQLKRVNSSPSIVKTIPKQSSNVIASKSCQEMKNLNHEQKQINKKSKTGSDNIHSVWNKTSRLPKLPKWVLEKHMSLDSTVSPFSSPEPQVKETRPVTGSPQHNIKIEQMFSQCQQKEDYSAANILPPINSSPNRKPTSSPLLSKKKPFIPTKKKQKQTVKSKDVASCAKGKKATKNILASSKRGKKKVKPIVGQKTQETDRASKKTNKGKKAIAVSVIVQEGDRSEIVEETSRSGVFITKLEIDDSEEKENSNFYHEEDMSTSSNNLKMQEDERKLSDNTVDSLDGAQSHDETLDDFYDAVLAAQPIQKTQVNRSLSVPEPNIDFLSEKSSNLTKLNMENHNHVAETNTDSIDVDTYDISESMERTLSLDGTTIPEQIAFRKQPANASYSKFLSKISEEKSNSSSLRSRKPSTSATTGKSSFMSSFMSSEGNTFKEMSHLMFQPGLVPAMSPSLKSVTLNHTFSSDSSSACSNDRPYLQSVLGTASRLSIYSSSSGVSQDSDVSVLEWQKGKMIDKGAFGVVYQGLTSNAQLIAVKEVNIGQSKNTARNFRKLQDEISILKGLKHPNVIKFIGTSLQDGVVYIFMEYIAGGSLAGLISSFGPLNESIFQRYTKQILSAVAYLHDCAVIHRDIKGANILITVKGSIKLIDFGCAKELSLSLGSVVLLKSIKGTPYWMAPEVIQGTGCNHKSDIWSIGCTVMEMATGKPPWSEYPPYAAMYAVADESNATPTLDTFQHSKDAVEFVQLCLQRNMNDRPSAADLLTHPFVSAVT